MSKTNAQRTNLRKKNKQMNELNRELRTQYNRARTQQRLNLIQGAKQ